MEESRQVESAADVEMNEIIPTSYGQENNNNTTKSQDPWQRTQPDSNDADQLLNSNMTEAERKANQYQKEVAVKGGTGGFAISVFNLMNAVLGSGILGLSYAMSQLGAVLFFCLLSFVSVLCLYAIHLLLVLCELTGVKAYEKLGERALGPAGKYLAATCILMQNIGAMSSYLFIVKYELPQVLMTMTDITIKGDQWWLNGDYLVIVVTLVIIMPLASLKNIGFLGYTSGFSITCMLFFTGVIVAKKFMIDCPLPINDQELNYLLAANNMTLVNNTVTALAAPTTAALFKATEAMVTEANHTTNSSGSVIHISDHSTANLYMEFGEQECEAKTLELSDKWAYSIPTMMFSFVCHTAVLPIYAELKNPSPERMQKVANTSISICYILYALASLFGYLTFYNWMEPELLLMYSFVDAADMLTMMVRITVLIAVVLTVPLTHFPARKAMTFLLFPDREFKWSHHLGIMCFLLTTINIFVIFVPSIKDVFGIIGATASTMLVFVLPSLFFIIIDPRPAGSLKKISAYAMCGLGVCLMIQSLTTIIIGYF